MRAASLRVAVLASLAVVSGCDRSVTAPAPSSGAANATISTILGTPTAVNVVTRNTPLATSQTASATFGIFGGQLSLPGAGLKVVVPPFALKSSTRITVTAVAGNQVAYEFEPHGIRFLVPLVVTQNLSGTSAVSGGLISRPIVAGYFSSLSDLDPLAGTGLVTELLGTAVSLATKTATFPVFHFSGYLIATGKSQSSAEEESASQ